MSALPTPAVGAHPAQADTDETLILLWLDGRSHHAARAYEADVRAFLAHVGKPLRAVTVGDVQGFGASLATLAPASRARKIGAVKSLVSFGHCVGYLSFDVARHRRKDVDSWAGGEGVVPPQ